MRILAGQTVLLTGASGGIGVYIARAFARLGVRQALVAYPGTGLEELRTSIHGMGAHAIAMAADLRDPATRHDVLQKVRASLGPIDILVNNAGLEYTAAYHDLSEQQIADILNINLVAPMVLSRLVLPEMLARKQGHIVNMSSLAGKSGPAYQEPYAATKAALVGFTASLRSTYRGTGVSASAIVPGFVEAGIYAKLKQVSGRAAPPLLKPCSPERVAAAVLRAIEKDLPELVVSTYPVRPLLALIALSPSFGGWVASRLGGDNFFHDVIRAQNRAVSTRPPA